MAPWPPRPAWPTRGLLLLLAAAVCLCPTRGASQASAPAAAPKVAIVGVDAADWAVIDELVAAGRLPAFARLKKGGTIGVLKATPPLISPIVWTTVATGRLPEEHGVLDFMVDVPGGPAVPVHGGVRRVKAMWEIWSDASRPVLVAGWWATWPADPVRGVIASDMLASPHLRDVALPSRGLVHPPEAMTAVSRHVVTPSSLDRAALSRFVPLTRAEFDAALADEAASRSRLFHNRVAHLRAAVAGARSWKAIVASQLEKGQPDLVAVYYELVDTVSHLFVRDRRHGEGAIAAAYEEVDAALADLVSRLDPATLVLVLSDHGFYPADAGVREDPSDLTSGATAWHRPYGIFAAGSAGVVAGTRPPSPSPPLGVVSPLDVLPTLLAYAGLPVAADMPGRVLTALAGSAPPRRLPSYGAHTIPQVQRASAGADSEVQRLRALGYVSGAGEVTSLARVNLGEILYRKGDFGGAIRELEAVLRVSPLNERACLWLARSQAAAGQPDEALRVYDRLLGARQVEAETKAAALLAATELDLQAGRVDAALERVDRAPATLDEAPEALVARGDAAEAEGRRETAERLYRSALNVAPSDTTALQRLVDLLVADGRAGMARTLAARLAQACPSSPLHLALAGHASLAMKRYAEAARWFESALGLAPDAESVRIGLARARLMNGRPEGAIDALSDVRPSRETEALLGAALAATENWQGSIAALERALSSGEPTTELLNALGRVQLQAGRAADAVQTLEKSLALSPDQPEVRAMLEAARKK